MLIGSMTAYSFETLEELKKYAMQEKDKSQKTFINNKINDKKNIYKYKKENSQKTCKMTKK